MAHRICGCALKPKAAASLARSTMHTKPLVANGAPRSDLKTKGDFGSCAKHRPQRAQFGRRGLDAWRACHLSGGAHEVQPAQNRPVPAANPLPHLHSDCADRRIGSSLCRNSPNVSVVRVGLIFCAVILATTDTAARKIRAWRTCAGFARSMRQTRRAGPTLASRRLTPRMSVGCRRPSSSPRAKTFRATRPRRSPRV